MPILLSDEEIEAMEGLPHLHRSLYIFGIRKYMDYQTGVTGIKRKISYKSLSEEVYVVPHQGYVNSGAISREALRRAVKALEKTGLITIKSNDKNLILKCNLARQDKSVQNKPDTNPTPQADIKPDTLSEQETSKNNYTGVAGRNLAQIPDTQADIPQNEKPDTHPISDTLHNITLPRPMDFFQLLAKCGFPLHQIQNNKSTLAMVNEWIKAKVTLDEAQIGINHVNSSKGIPNSPTYYLKPVLQVRNDFEKAQQQASEVKHAKQQPAQSSQSRYPKSATKRFWENAEDILRGLDKDDD